MAQLPWRRPAPAGGRGYPGHTDTSSPLATGSRRCRELQGVDRRVSCPHAASPIELLGPRGSDVVAYGRWIVDGKSHRPSAPSRVFTSEAERLSWLTRRGRSKTEFLVRMPPSSVLQPRTLLAARGQTHPFRFSAPCPSAGVRPFTRIPQGFASSTCRADQRHFRDFTTTGGAVGISWIRQPGPQLGMNGATGPPSPTASYS